MPEYQYGNTSIECKMEQKPEAKDIIISVDWINDVKLVTPPSVDDIKLLEVLHKKSHWILSRFEFEEITASPSPEKYISVEKFLYLGRSYRLKVQKVTTDTLPSLVFQQGHFKITVSIKLTNTLVTEQLLLLFVN